MKFHQVPLGKRFEYRNEPYYKTAPLLGTQEQTGQQRVIPRSAQVTLAGDERKVATGSGRESTATLNTEVVLSALDDFQSTCLAGLSTLLGAGQLEYASSIFDRARADFCRALSDAPLAKK
ncbi:hypothetical protein [Thiohalomonas denitrificans]|uniref:Uncharacterized protein n=1 Tax=Thiohalomonas denitrificans TaxID=415747 RepID=A0A1G5PR59_9GAMM|nr:hypothetical protein [Thiohalomonas denitrificans]SCZ51888.1 hypothetical protein SAMN03097708_00614 [Thiohalomonas denitrificans]